MALTASVISIDTTQAGFQVYGQITPSGNYAANGDTLDLSGLGVASSYPPFYVAVWETVPQGAAARGDEYRYIPASTPTQANGVLQILGAASGAAPTELTSAAYSGQAPTNISGYALYFMAYFASL